MPYTKPAARAAVDVSLNAVKTVGDLNYYFTKAILKVWQASPRYSTYHNLKRDLQKNPKDSALVNHVRRAMAGDFSVADVYTAADAAMVEFERRVISVYEDSKIKENSDLPEYQAAIDAIINPKKEEPTEAVAVDPGV